MYRQHRCAGLAGDPQKALRPAGVADAIGMDAAYLASREDDHRLIALQAAVNLAQARARLAAKHVARYQQRRQAIESQQVIIGHDAHIATHPPNQLQQTQRIDGTERVIGNNDYPAFARDVLDIGRFDPITRTELEQAVIDEVKAMSAMQAADGLVDLILTNHSP